MPCAPLTLAALVFLASAGLAAATKPGTPCGDLVGASGLRICSELDESALRRGKPATWRIWLEGGGYPFNVRLHNNLPGVLQLEGGDDQIVHMGCRWHRQVRRKVRWIAPTDSKNETGIAGGPESIVEITEGLKVRLYSPSPRREASTIAAALTPLLAHIEAEFIERRGKLSQTPDFSTKDVNELLETTEKDLLDALSYQELAALRDYVQQKFREARSALEASSRTTRTAQAHFATSRRIVFASFSNATPTLVVPTATRTTPPGHGTVPELAADSVLDQILRKIHRLYEMANQNDLTTALCVVSEPESGARFFMRPQSFDRKHDTLTTGKITSLYRGLYIYKMWKGFREIRCLDPDHDDCGIDLVDDPSPALRCNLNDRGCKRPPGPLSEPECNGTKP